MTKITESLWFSIMLIAFWLVCIAGLSTSVAELFANEEYFSEQKKFSLEKLRDVDNAAHNFAKFSVKFEGVKKARPIDIRAGNRATFSRNEDFLVVEDWINDQQLVIPKNPTQEAS